jgi:two-component system, NarL family, sensor kinase
MRRDRPGDRGAALALALLRATLVAVIFVSERLIQARQLADAEFFAVLMIAGCYSLLGIAVALGNHDRAPARVLAALQPGFDVLLLIGLAYTSGGAFSDVRKAFFVVPLAAAFSERPRETAGWSLLAVIGFSAQAAIAGGHPVGAQNSWLRMTINQDLYLGWTGAAATLLALGLRRRTAHTEELATSRQRLVTRAIESVERERTRLAGALHDSPVQNLIAARHDLRRAERTGDSESFRRLHAALDDTITQLREEIFNLHPHVLDHVGLGAALEQVARRAAGEGEVEITVEVGPHAGDEHRQVLFALGRELLANAAKHASARQIALRVWRTADGVALEVTDDGRGIAAGRPRQALQQGHVGLASVHERVSALDGRVQISTAAGLGTRVLVAIPRAVAPDVSDRVTSADTLRVSPA